VKKWEILPVLVVLGLLAGQVAALTVHQVTFELSDFGWQNYAKLIEPDDTCSGCDLYAPFEGNLSYYSYGIEAGSLTAFNGKVLFETGWIGQALNIWPATHGEYTYVILPRSSSNDITLFVRARINSYGPTDNTINDYELAFWFRNGSLAKSLLAELYNDARTWRLYSAESVQNKYVNVEIPLRQWFDVVIIKKGTTAELWYNGKLIATVEYTEGLDDVEFYTKGNITIDELRIFSRALSKEEVDALRLGRYRYALWKGDEPNLPSWLNATVFCPLDDLDTVNNTTTVYINGQASTATVYNAENASLTSGWIGNGFYSSSNAGISTGYTYSTNLTAFTFTMAIKIDSYPATRYALIGRINSGYEGIDLLIDSTGHLRPRLTDTAGNINEYVTTNTIPLGEKVFIAVVFDGSAQTLKVRINDKVETFSVGYQTVRTENILLFIGYEPYNPFYFKGMIDEFRFYENRALSESELDLLYYINRYKYATLSAPSATFSNNQFLVNITAVLPNDGGSYLLPAPLGATGLTAVGSIGNITFLDAGSAGQVSYTFTATPGQAVPGVGRLGIETDEGVYAYGTGSMTLSTPTSTMYLATNTIAAGKVTAVSWSGVGTLRVLDTALYVQSGDGVLEVKKATPELIEINAQSVTSPVKITATNLLPYVDYNVLHDNNKVTTFSPNDQGVATFEITAAGDWLIGTVASVWDSVGSNVIAITTTALIVAIFAMMVVERTPAKFDDNVMKALLAMLMLAIVAGLIKLIMLLH